MEQLFYQWGVLFYAAKDIEERGNYANLSVFLLFQAVLHIKNSLIWGPKLLFFWHLVHSTNCVLSVCALLSF